MLIHQVTARREPRPPSILVTPKEGYLSPPQDREFSWTDYRTFIDPLNGIRQMERLLYSQNDPFKKGQQFELDGVFIEIVNTTKDNRPATVRFDFDTVLEDPKRIWLRWNKQTWKYVHFTLPAIGGIIVLE